MERLLKSILTIREIKFRMDDDYVDRLNRQYTVIILICCNKVLGISSGTSYLRICTVELGTCCHHPHLLRRTCHDETVRWSADHVLVSGPVHRQPPRVRRLHLLGQQHVLPADGRDDPRRATGQAEHPGAHKLLPVGAARAAVPVVDHVLALSLLALLQPTIRHQHDGHHGRGARLLASVLHRNTRKGYFECHLYEICMKYSRNKYKYKYKYNKAVNLCGLH